MNDQRLASDERVAMMDASDSVDHEESRSESGELLFSVLRRRDDETLGPMTQSELLEKLRLGEVDKSDMVFFEGSPGWEPIEEVFEIHEQLRHFVEGPHR